MKKRIDKIAMYLALILVSSIQLPMDVLADEKQNPSILPMPRTGNSASVAKHRILSEKEQHIVKEAAEAVSKIHQALDALDKSDMKKAFFTLQTASEKLDGEIHCRMGKNQA